MPMQALSQPKIGLEIAWMKPKCDKIILHFLNKNYINIDENPITTELQVLTMELLIII